MTEMDYDVTVIGAGPGGYVAAIRAAQLGLRVALVERERLGGVCLNWGCIPTKALLRNAEVIDLLGKGREFGFAFDGLEVDYGAAVDRSRKVSERLVKGVEGLMRKNGVDVVQGVARLKSARAVEVTANRSSDSAAGQSGVRVLMSRNVVIATGARTRSLPGVAPDGERILTYREAIVQRSVPASVIVVGAGPIGMEFAHIWRTYGAEVTIVEMLSRVLPLEDEEVSEVVARAFKRRKVKILTATQLDTLEAATGGVQVQLKNEQGGETLEAEQVLIAIGMVPNSHGLGLEAAGVQMEKGYIAVDEAMRTSVPGVYAIGDVTGKLALAHVASAQGILAAETIAGVGRPTPRERRLDYDAMPRCVYCQPQVASFGLTEAQAAERGHDIKVGRFPFLASGKALALGEREGFVKIVTDAHSGEILGGHLVGPEVTELLPELVLARNSRLTPEEIVRSVHAHPTLSEALVEAAHGVFGASIHA